MSIGKRIKQRRKELGLSVEEVAKQLNKNRATVYRYESDEIENMPTTVLEPLAKVLKTTPAELMGWTSGENLEMINGLHLINKIKRIPILGTIACGKPILACETHKDYFMLDNNLPDADYILRAKGDSMIDANIFDGDLVFIKKDACIENGNIAAVLIDDEATLKRVTWTETAIILMPCNRKYKPITLDKNKENQILGKMVGVFSRRSV